MTKSFNDILEDLLEAEEREPAVLPASYVKPDYTEPCKACGGTGKFRSYSGRIVGDCFKCRGAGKKTFKTSPEVRTDARIKAGEKRVERVREKAKDIEVWKEEHAAEWRWMREAARRNDERNGHFDFPINMINALNKYGSLTTGDDGSSGQLGAVRKLMLRDAERAASFKKNAKELDVSRLQVAFDKAREKAARPGALGVWVKPLCLATTADKDDADHRVITFSPGTVGSQWEGMVFAKDGGRKLGHVKDGKFFRKFACTDADETVIRALAEDPEQSAVAYGKAWSRCAVCHKTLTKDESIERGIGPICAKKFGW